MNPNPNPRHHARLVELALDHLQLVPRDEDRLGRLDGLLVVRVRVRVRDRVRARARARVRGSCTPSSAMPIGSPRRAEMATSLGLG